MRGVVGDRQPIDAAADDEDVEGTGGETVEIARHATVILTNPVGYSLAVATTDEIRVYWDRHIHDLDITTHPVARSADNGVMFWSAH